MKQIILKPTITEKAMNMISDGKYTFEVAKDANKIEIAQAIKVMYKVDPISVNVMNIKSKNKSYKGRWQGQTRSWQKAIVRLKKGQKIAEFDVKS